MFSEPGALMPAQARRWALKHATEAAHQKVEAIVERAGVFSSRPAYLRYLEATFRLRERFERQLQLSGADEILPDWPSRRIADLVAADISDLGGRPLSPDVSPTPTLTRAEILGVSYVLEGSSLGARLLVKRAAELGFGPQCGARHLNHQASDRRGWPTFIAAMESAREPPCQAAAIRTFEAFADAYAGMAREAS